MSESVPSTPTQTDETKRPHLRVINGGAEQVQDPDGSFFNNANEQKDGDFYLAVAFVKERIDLKKMYGKGTIIEPTTAGRLRHISQISELKFNQTPDDIIKHFHHMENQRIGEKKLKDIFDVDTVASAVSFLNSENDDY